MSSDITKVTRYKLWLFRALDFLMLFTPLVIYIGIALTGDGITTTGRVSVVGTVAIAGILCVFNVICQKKLRCPLWIVLIGLFVAIRDYLLPLIIILAVTSILDDLLFAPLINYYHTKLIAHKAIDEREPDGN